MVNGVLWEIDESGALFWLWCGCGIGRVVMVVVIGAHAFPNLCPASVPPAAARNLQMAIVQGTMLHASEHTWNGRAGVEGECPRAIN